MDDRIITGPLAPDTTVTAAAEPLPASSPVGDFRDALREAARSIAAGEATIDHAVSRLSHGRSMTPEELIALQATVYRHAAEVEMAAKLVDKLTGAVRTALTSQQ